MAEWGIIVYFLVIGVLIFVAKVLKTWVPGLNKIVIPSSLLGGIIGLTISLVFAPILIGKETFFDVDAMGYIVYHALAIGFIALALKTNKTESKKKIWSTGMLITTTYALHAVIGIILVLTLFSDKFVGSGMLVALGFGQGPGLAYAIGKSWTNQLGGFGEALGVSYALLGFLTGGVVGVFLINLISRKQGRDKPKTYEETSVTTEVIEVEKVKEISILDGLTTQAVIIAIIYGLVYLTLLLADLGLSKLGTTGEQAFGLIKGFNFIIGIVYALIYKQILKAFERKGKNIRFMTNNYILSNIGSLAFNVMITGSVLMITLDFLSSFGVQLIVTSAFAGFFTLIYLRYMTRKVYVEHQDEYYVALFGMLTGVASTGVALLKGVDPNLETPVAEELVLGSGTAITMALPLFLIMFIPTFTYDSGNHTLWSIIALLGCIVYIAIFVSILLVRGKRGVNV